MKSGSLNQGWGAQNSAIFFRMLDKDSNWGYDNGLKTLIPTLLQFGLEGYPYVLPDMIGGNGYGDPPDRELFIRWLQANVFMPAMQFSYAPWNYDQEVTWSLYIWLININTWCSDYPKCFLQNQSAFIKMKWLNNFWIGVDSRYCSENDWVTHQICWYHWSFGDAIHSWWITHQPTNLVDRSYQSWRTNNRFRL